MKIIRFVLPFVLFGTMLTGRVFSETTLVPTNVPTEVYGHRGDAIVLRIGNDSAGASGILRLLSNDYINTHHLHGAIAWYQDSDANAVKQLRIGNIDMALVTEHALVDAAVRTQSVTYPSVVFRSRVVLVGPRNNPAQIHAGDSSILALQKIERFGSLRVAAGGSPAFLSRDDRSANNEKERVLWARAGFTPWVSHQLWYRCDHVFAHRALLDAEHESLYTLVDYATWTMLAPHLPRLRMYVAHGAELESSNIALLRPYPAARVRAFLRYLQSERAQNIIARY